MVTRNGYDWSHRFPLIVEAALRIRQTYFVIDGEAMLLGGRSDFNGVRSRQGDEESRSMPSTCWSATATKSGALTMRKSSLTRLLARRVDGKFLSAFEQGEIGPDLFRHACLAGLEGLVSKRADSRYRGGRSPDLIKVKTACIRRWSRLWKQCQEHRSHRLERIGPLRHDRA